VDLDLPEKALIARVTGRVQGVSFRAWTEGRARALGLTGWVKNEYDGSVSVLIAGEAAALAEMEKALHEGPRWARVDRVTIAPADPKDAPPDFRITG
jgi:acylphosphatase